MLELAPCHGDTGLIRREHTAITPRVRSHLIIKCGAGSWPGAPVVIQTKGPGMPESSCPPQALAAAAAQSFPCRGARAQRELQGRGTPQPGPGQAPQLLQRLHTQQKCQGPRESQQLPPLGRSRFVGEAHTDTMQAAPARRDTARTEPAVLNARHRQREGGAGTARPQGWEPLVAQQPCSLHCTGRIGVTQRGPLTRLGRGISRDRACPAPASHPCGCRGDSAPEERSPEQSRAAAGNQLCSCRSWGCSVWRWKSSGGSQGAEDRAGLF